MRAMFSFHGGHHLYDNRGLPDDVDVLAHAVLFLYRRNYFSITLVIILGVAYILESVEG